MSLLQRSSRGKLDEKHLIFFDSDSAFEKYSPNQSSVQPDSLKASNLGPGVSDGPKLDLLRGGADQYTTGEGNVTALPGENLQCDYDNFQAHFAGGSTQGPASEIPATETATERKGEGKSGQRLRGLASPRVRAPLSLFYATALLLTSESSVALRH